MTPPISTDELCRYRRETPGVSGHTFLLSCGASLMPEPVVAAMHDFLDLETRLGGYGAATAEASRLDGVYDSVARLINASRDEVALVENATVAWQLAFYGMAFRPGDVVITAEAEYAANYVAFLQVQKRTGLEIRVCPSAETGELDCDALRAMIDDRVKLIAITWVPTNGGLVNPAVEVGRIARAAGIPYLLDACQAVGQLPVDVEELQCDYLTATSRKFLRGPRGAGFLYVRKAMLHQVEPPLIDHFGARWTARDRYTLRPDARRYESWENNYVARLGMGLAADYAMEVGLERIAARCDLLCSRLRDGLSGIDGAEVLDLGRHPSSIVSFRSSALPAAELVQSAAEAGIVIMTSAPESTRLDAERRGLGQIARAAPHYFNTEEEIDVLLAFVAAQSRAA